MSRRVLVTGGAGYLGIPVVEALLSAGWDVRVLDALLHGRDIQVPELQRLGAQLFEGDVRDPAARSAALDTVHGVVHLAAIVGDPACAREPALAHEVNVRATHALVADAAAAGAQRLIFASTCSNYGRMTDPTVPITEDGMLSPVSLYAEQKVAVERVLLGARTGIPCVTSLRFATLYGVAPRMRFDLTVNEFTRDLWADRELEVFGERFWRPYVHVRDAARAVACVLDAPPELVAGAVFNVGDTRENYRKLDLVELISRQVDRGRVSFVHRQEDPRDYKVSFERIGRVLGFRTNHSVPEGIAQIVDALDGGAFADAFDGRYRNAA
jgi:nucleoside-diphosphate-sugar epimerase